MLAAEPNRAAAAQAGVEQQIEREALRVPTGQQASNRANSSPVQAWKPPASFRPERSDTPRVGSDGTSRRPTGPSARLRSDVSPGGRSDRKGQMMVGPLAGRASSERRSEECRSNDESRPEHGQSVAKRPRGHDRDRRARDRRRSAAACRADSLVSLHTRAAVETSAAPLSRRPPQ